MNALGNYPGSDKGLDGVHFQSSDDENLFKTSVISTRHLRMRIYQDKYSTMETGDGSEITP